MNERRLARAIIAMTFLALLLFSDIRELPAVWKMMKDYYARGWCR